MKTKELIRQLQEHDPTGENECVVDGVDIHFVQHYPGYYDGWYEVLIRDPERTGRCYDVQAVRMTRAGQKVRLHLHSAEDALLDNYNMPIELDESLGSHKERIQSMVDKWRNKSIQMDEELEREALDEKNRKETP